MPGWLVHRHPAALVERQVDIFGAQAVGVGDAADRDDQAVALEHVRRVAAFVFDGDLGMPALLALRHLADPGVELDLQALLLGEGLPRLLGHGGIGRSQEIGQGLEHGDVGAKALPLRTQFQADDAGTDHAQSFGSRVTLFFLNSPRMPAVS